MGQWVWECDCDADDEDDCTCDELEEESCIHCDEVYEKLHDWKDAYASGNLIDAKQKLYEAEMLIEAKIMNYTAPDTAQFRRLVEQAREIAYYYRADDTDRLQNIANDTPYYAIQQKKESLIC